MSGSDQFRYKVKQGLMAMPGKRGIDIPEDEWDRIHEAASGITLGVWGMHPTPHQMQALYEGGHTTPEAVNEVFGQMPHPHSPDITVSQYPSWAKAYEVHENHS